MNVLQFFIDLFYPPRCPFCGSLLSPYCKNRRYEGVFKDSLEGLETVLCQDCLFSLPWLECCCSRCALPLPHNLEFCAYCSALDFAFDGCSAVGRYKEGMQDILHRFKYRGQKSLAEPLGKLIAIKVKSMAWCSSLDFVTPVPPALEKLLQRGYNQAALLAQVVGKELQLPVLDLLKRNKNTKSQTGLNRQQRRMNMRGSFTVNNVHQKGSVLLVDDVFTSGSTAHEASLVLKKAGCKQVYVAVLAR